MRVDFTQVLVDLDGQDIEVDAAEGAKEKLTLERVAVSALLQGNGREQQTGEDKYKRFKLMKQIHGATEPVEMPTEDVSLVKKAIGESGYTALVTGQSWDMIEHGKAE